MIDTTLLIDEPQQFWQRLLRSLYKSKTALAASLILLILLLFAVVGPLVWSVDPYLQNPARASLPPFSKAIEASVVEGLAPQEVRQAALGFNASAANTEFVQLHWPQLQGVSRYRLYRAKASLQSGLGLPLATLDGAQQSFTDAFELKPQSYRYTLQAFASDESLMTSDSLQLSPQAAVSAFDAQMMGLEIINAKVILPAHPLGSDQLGRDMLARLMLGSRVSLLIGLLAPLIFVSAGAMYGAVAAYAGATVDNVMMRCCDLVVALPFLLFMILFKVVLGTGINDSGLWPMLVVLCVLSWPSTARLVRAEVLQLRSCAYIEAARLMGAGSAYVLWRHMLPNILPVLVVTFTFAVPSAIFTEAFLSFLGLGINAPMASWGSMSYEGLSNLAAYPHELLLPSALIALTVLAFNLLGDALRDALQMQTAEKLQ